MNHTAIYNREDYSLLNNYLGCPKMVVSTDAITQSIDQ